MWGDAQQHGALEAGGAQPPDVGVLDITDPTVDDFEAVSRGAGREVLALDQRGAEAAQRGLARGGRAARAATDDQHVEKVAPQALGIPGEGLSQIHAS